MIFKVVGCLGRTSLYGFLREQSRCFLIIVFADRELPLTLERLPVDNPKRRIKVGYLSASPRVSTYSDSETGGPRSHILGVISVFEEYGWKVLPFIVGDRTIQSWHTGRIGPLTKKNFVTKLLADVMRLILGLLNAFRAWHELGCKVDVVYERFTVLQQLGWIFKNHNVPWVLETSALYYYEAQVERQSLVLARIAQWIELRAYRSCDLLICVSEPLKKMILNAVHIPEEKILVVPNGVDVSYFNPDICSEKRIFENFTVGYVGRLIKWQGIDILLEAIHLLKQEGINLSVVLVGDGSAREELNECVQKLNLEPNVHFVGQVSRDQVPAYIKGFDIGYSGQVVLQIGAMYHSPLKLYEYMAMGKPVVASDFDDARHIVKNAEIGFLFEASNYENLAHVLKDAYLRRDELAAMGHKGRDCILTQHSWTVRLDPVIEAIKELL